MHPSFNFESSDYLKFIAILELNAWLILIYMLQVFCTFLDDNIHAIVLNTQIMTSFPSSRS